MKHVIGYLGSILIGALLAGACYDASKLPPCHGGEKWPDPCAGAVRDAGADG